MPPHDEENGRADEAELNGAGKQEGRTVLNQLGRNVKQQAGGGWVTLWSTGRI